MESQGHGAGELRATDAGASAAHPASRLPEDCRTKRAKDDGWSSGRPGNGHARLAMPRGKWEMVCHPGYNDEALALVTTRLRASREVEREALLEVLGSDAFPQVRLVGFDAL